MKSHGMESKVASSRRSARAAWVISNQRATSLPVASFPYQTMYDRPFDGCSLGQFLYSGQRV
eukprot:3546645-Alexandrium_andersonii.AAC.1